MMQAITSRVGYDVGGARAGGVMRGFGDIDNRSGFSANAGDTGIADVRTCDVMNIGSRLATNWDPPK